MKTDKLDIRHMDCMELMKQYPDNHFDLAVVDPPYGIKVTKNGKIGQTGRGQRKGGSYAHVSTFEKKDWDDRSPTAEYFDELKRVSKNQIIWGANHMMSEIMMSSSSWIVWDKVTGTNDFADCELAYTSHKKAARICKYMWNGYMQGNSVGSETQIGNHKKSEKRIHPTQKPVKLYDWIFANYAEKGMNILDTHLGSGSIAIAAHYAEMHLTACELDEDYYKAACERIHIETSQTILNL